MIQEETDRRSSPAGLRMSTKASAFSIAAIIGEQPLKRASDNVSPSGKFKFYVYYLLTDVHAYIYIYIFYTCIHNHIN